MANPTSIPNEALGLAIFVLIYSATCLCCSVLLYLLLWRAGSRFSYTSLIAIFTSIATIASIAQQIHFIVDWRNIQIAKVDDLAQGSASSILGNSVGIDLWLFWVQFYSYNVESLLVLFWSIQLFKSTWRIIPNHAWSCEQRIELLGKTVAVVLPGVVIGIIQAESVQEDLVAFIIVCNSVLTLSLFSGIVFVGLTLYKFVQSRRDTDLSTDPSESDSSAKQQGTTITAGVQNSFLSSISRRPTFLSARRAGDRWLIIRFTIAFAILGVFEVAIVLFQVTSYAKAIMTMAIQEPDLQIGQAKIDLVLFMPGVTASLVAFLIWGTTAPFRKDMRFLFSCGRSRREVSHTLHNFNHRITPRSRGTMISNASDEMAFAHTHQSDEDLELASIHNNGSKVEIHVTTELSIQSEEGISDLVLEEYPAGYGIERWPSPLAEAQLGPVSVAVGHPSAPPRRNRGMNGVGHVRSASHQISTSHSKRAGHQRSASHQISTSHFWGGSHQRNASHQRNGSQQSMELKLWPT